MDDVPPVSYEPPPYTGTESIPNPIPERCAPVAPHERANDHVAYIPIANHKDASDAFVSTLKAVTKARISRDLTDEVVRKFAKEAASHPYTRVFPLDDSRNVSPMLKVAAQNIAEFLIMTRVATDDTLIGSPTISTILVVRGNSTSVDTLGFTSVQTVVKISCNIYLRDDPSAFDLKRHIGWKAYEVACGCPPPWTKYVTHGRYRTGRLRDAAVLNQLYNTDEARAKLAADLDAFLTMAEAREIDSGRWVRVIKTQSSPREQCRRKIKFNLSSNWLHW